VISIIDFIARTAGNKGLAKKDMAIKDDWKGVILIRNEYTMIKIQLGISDKDIHFSLVIYGAFLCLGFKKAWSK
jgi:hypothetical protein